MDSRRGDGLALHAAVTSHPPVVERKERALGDLHHSQLTEEVGRREFAKFVIFTFDSVSTTQLTTSQIHYQLPINLSVTQEKQALAPAKHIGEWMERSDR